MLSPSNAGLDLKSRRGESSEAGSSSKRRRRRKAGSDDDDDDWVPGLEEAPRRSRRGNACIVSNSNASCLEAISIVL